MNELLEGVRVVDLTQVVAGPYCTQLLGDLGADIIKIESPAGDLQRTAMRGPDDQADSAAFMSLNRNKRSVVIDLTQPDGHAVFIDLVRKSDVLVENFRPGVTTKLGIDYAALSTIQPSLVYATITGFGEGGPYASRPGLDLIAQAMSGIISVTGNPNESPVKCGVPVTDLAAGSFCAIGILAALIARNTSGSGNHINTSLFEAGLALGVNETASYWATGQVPPPLGSSHRFAAPYQALRTEDGHITVGAGSQKLWTALCGAIQRTDLLDDERFNTNLGRMRNRAALQVALEATLASRTTDAWVDALLAAGVPAGPVLDYAQVVTDPHTLGLGMVVTMQHPQAGDIKAVASPLQVAGHRPDVKYPPPLLGQHTADVLEEFGIAPERIMRLAEMGVVAAPDRSA